MGTALPASPAAALQTCEQVLMRGRPFARGEQRLTPSLKYTPVRPSTSCTDLGERLFRLEKACGCGEERPEAAVVPAGRGAGQAEASGPFGQRFAFHFTGTLRVGSGGPRPHVAHEAGRQQVSGEQVHRQGLWLSHLDSSPSLVGGRTL